MHVPDFWREKKRPLAFPPSRSTGPSRVVIAFPWAMVRTKSSEQAKRLAAKQAARKAKAPPDEPAQPDSFHVNFLGDRWDAADQPESAEEVARAETIAQTRLGAVMAATLCRTNFTQGLQGTSKAVVELLGEGSMVPRKDWFGPMVPDGVRERER